MNAQAAAQQQPPPQDPNLTLLGGPLDQQPGQAVQAGVVEPDAAPGADVSQAMAAAVPEALLPPAKIWTLRPLAGDGRTFIARFDAKPRKAQSTPPPRR